MDGNGAIEDLMTFRFNRLQLFQARRRQDIEVPSLQRERSTAISLEETQAWMLAVAKNDLKTMTELVSDDPHVVCAEDGFSGRNVLHYAARRGSETMLAVACKGMYASMLNARDMNGRTCLHEAYAYNVRGSHANMIGMLMDLGADDSITDWDGLTPKECKHHSNSLLLPQPHFNQASSGVAALADACDATVPADIPRRSTVTQLFKRAVHSKFLSSMRRSKRRSTATAGEFDSAVKRSQSEVQAPRSPEKEYDIGRHPPGSTCDPATPALRAQHVIVHTGALVSPQTGDSPFTFRAASERRRREEQERNPPSKKFWGKRKVKGLIGIPEDESSI
eukprot:m.19789 g.19789  ORF g.19789 m.19789 type:complete len:335 (+) comp8085_c0_seq3:83-1087(+)